MFTGFSKETYDFFAQISLENTKARFAELRPLYEQCVKAPLRALHADIAPGVLALAPDVCARPARCVSGAYNDARFSPGEPIKTYMYLHFMQETARYDNLPGFFFDAGREGWRCGLHLYHRTSAGMRAIAEYALAHKEDAHSALTALPGNMTFTGERFKRDRAQGAQAPLADFLNLREISLQAHEKAPDTSFAPGLTEEILNVFANCAQVYRLLCAALGA